MKSSFTIAVWMTLASIVAKLTMFSFDVVAQRTVMVSAFINLLVILVGTFFGVRQFKINAGERTGFKEDVKAGMRVGAIYALLMSVFVYFYYSNIDTTFFAEMIQNRMEMAQRAADAGTEVDMENVRQLGTFIFSARTHATITLFAFLLSSALYALMVSFFMRRLPGFK
jgi:cation transport ATPase